MLQVTEILPQSVTFINPLFLLRDMNRAIVTVLFLRILSEAVSAGTVAASFTITGDAVRNAEAQMNATRGADSQITGAAVGANTGVFQRFLEWVKSLFVW